MSEEELLNVARSYCDPKTGEVVSRIPEGLMRRLRDGNLARGIPGRRSKATESRATWYVFLNEDIRDVALKQWRAANKELKRRRKENRPSN